MATNSSAAPPSKPSINSQNRASVLTGLFHTHGNFFTEAYVAHRPIGPVKDEVSVLFDRMGIKNYELYSFPNSNPAVKTGFVWWPCYPAAPTFGVRDDLFHRSTPYGADRLNTLLQISEFSTGGLPASSLVGQLFATISAVMIGYVAWRGGLIITNKPTIGLGASSFLVVLGTNVFLARSFAPRVHRRTAKGILSGALTISDCTDCAVEYADTLAISPMDVSHAGSLLSRMLRTDDIRALAYQHAKENTGRPLCTHHAGVAATPKSKDSGVAHSSGLMQYSWTRSIMRRMHDWVYRGDSL